MTSPIIVPEIEALLGHHLPGYGEARERFPLWTYDRDAWRGVPLVEQHRWGPDQAVQAVHRELRPLTPEGWLASFVTPAGPIRFVRHLEDAEGGRWFDPGDTEVEMPLRPRARVLAAFAATAAVPPVQPGDIQVPEHWAARPFGQPELQELADSLMGVLRRPGPDSPSLFDRFMAKAKEEEVSGADREGMRDLAEELAAQLGFTIPRGKGWLIKKIPGLRDRLYTETAELVAAVRDYRPNDGVLDLCSDLVRADAAGSGRIDPVTEGTVLKSHEVDRRRPPAGTVNLPVMLRFPFLTRAELQAIVKGNVGQRALAAALIADRTVAEIHPDTVRR